MTERIDISAEIASLCKKLGLEPTIVAELICRPADLEATVLLRDETGHKFLDAGGLPASETRRFKVRT